MSPTCRGRPCVRRSGNGFTIIELVIVMTVIAILCVLAIPRFMSARRRAASVEATATMGAIERSLKDYFNRHDEYPATSGVPNPAGGHYEIYLPMDSTLPGWTELSFATDGTYRYRYEWLTEPDDDGFFAKVVVHARGDTDNDGVFLDYTRTFVKGAWVSETLVDE